jgi:hypothetical protein
MLKPLLASAAAALLLPSCFLGRSTINEPLREAVVESLVPGRSTAGDVVALLGAPVEVVQLGRRSAYRYDSTVAKRTGLFLLVVGVYNNDQQSDRVWIFLDEEGVLTHVAASYHAGEARHRLPWQD